MQDQGGGGCRNSKSRGSFVPCPSLPLVLSRTRSLADEGETEREREREREIEGLRQCRGWLLGFSLGQVVRNRCYGMHPRKPRVPLLRTAAAARARARARVALRVPWPCE